MADHPIDIIIRARDQASRAIGNVNRSLGNMGRIAAKGAQTAVKNLAKIGAAAGLAGAGLLALGIRNGVQSLADLETAITSVNGAIKRMGLTGKVTGAQIARWANQIEAQTDAAFDDKEITAATANLIRYGNVGAANLRKAMEVMTDLAAKNGDVESTSKAMAKALADPTKATRLLKDAGVVLTEKQTQQIARLYEHNKLQKAQGIILDLVAQKTKNAAKNSVGPYGDALNVMADATEDAQRALGEGFLPVIQRAAKWISGIASDPKALATIREFGNSLADAFDEALTFAQKIPWASIGDGIKKAADFAGKLFDAFRSMPPEVQAMLVAIAGLDKLSGGAISGIVGELGKGLIKGVLGITAGVVHLKAGSVVGGGVPAPAGAAGAPITKGRVINAGMQLLVIGAVAAFADEINNALRGVAKDLRGQINVDGFWASIGVKDMPVPTSWPWGPNNTPTILPEVFGGNGLLGGNGAVPKSVGEITREQEDTTTAVTQGTAESLSAFRSGERTSAYGLANAARSSQMAGLQAAMASLTGARMVVAAVNGINIPAPIISTTTITNNQSTQSRNGRNSSRINDGGGRGNNNAYPV